MRLGPSGAPSALTQDYYYKVDNLNHIVSLIPQDSPTLDRQPVINRGYHSFISLDRLYKSPLYSNSKYFILGECVIPKGYQYYINYETGEFVSESIILKKLYESNESGSNRPSEE
jgi:hypothetical protein